VPCQSRSITASEEQLPRGLTTLVTKLVPLRVVQPTQTVEWHVIIIRASDSRIHFSKEVMQYYGERGGIYPQCDISYRKTAFFSFTNQIPSSVEQIGDFAT